MLATLLRSAPPPPALLPWVLLQTKVPDGALGRIAVWLGVGIAVVVVGLVVVSRIKKRFQDDGGPEATSAGFSLSDLREMHRAGEMSDEEFDKAKAKVIDAAKRAAERDAAKPAAPARPAPVVSFDDDEEEEDDKDETP
jgi:hypothetical protein